MDIPAKGDIWRYKNESADATFLITTDPVFKEIKAVMVGDPPEMAYVFQALRIANPTGFSVGKDLDERVIRVANKPCDAWWKKVA
jgi:hypothetical protein